MHAAISDLSGTVLNRLRKACAAAAASGGANPLFRVGYMSMKLFWCMLAWLVLSPMGNLFLFSVKFVVDIVTCSLPLFLFHFSHYNVFFRIHCFVVLQESTDAAFPDMDNFYGAESGPTIRSLMEVIAHNYILILCIIFDRPMATWSTLSRIIILSVYF